MPKTTKKRGQEREEVDLSGGFLNGLSNLIEKLGELAEKGKELQGVKEFGNDELKGVYGFTIRSNLGGSDDRTKGVKVEPFGNVRTDARTGRAAVHEVIEPPVDVFEEPDHVAVVAELPGQLDRILERELGPRADGKMRRVRRIAHEHDVAATVEMAPVAADQPVEVEPGGTAQVACIGHERRPVENFGEEFLAEGD